MPSTVTTVQLEANTVTPVNLTAPANGNARCVAVVFRAGTAPISVAIDGQPPARIEDQRTSVLTHALRKTLATLPASSPGLHLWSQSPATIDVEVNTVPTADVDTTMRRGRLAGVTFPGTLDRVWPDAA